MMNPTPGHFTAYLQSLRYSSFHRMNPHSHVEFELLYFIEGESHIRILDKMWIGAAGDLAIYHPGAVHEECIQPGCYRIFCLRFDPKHLGQVKFPGPNEVEPIVHLPWKERFHNLFEQIVLERSGTDEWSAILAGTYLIQFVILLWRALTFLKKNSDHKSSADPRIGFAIDLIHNSLTEELTLKELAEKVFMSESHFSHVFKDMTGQSPKRYLIESKIEKAKEVLEFSDKAIVEIAEELGYTDPHYFSRLFKKITGISPLNYREKRRKVH